MMRNIYRYLPMDINKSTWGLMRTTAILIFALVFGHISVAFASSVEAPIIRVNVSTALGFNTFSIDAGRDYNFSGSAVWASETNPLPDGTDIYFGLFSPDLDKVWTWSRNSSDESTLNDGFVPFALASTTWEFNTGNSIPYSFSGNESKGMYLLFLLLVSPGGDPSDISQWLYTGTHPFFLLDSD